MQQPFFGVGVLVLQLRVLFIGELLTVVVLALFEFLAASRWTNLLHGQ